MMRGNYRGLFAQDRPDVVTGVLWIRDCKITNDGTRVRFELAGNGWQWVDQSKHRLEEWQKEVDGKIRGAIETVQHSINPWAGVQKDVRTLADRIAELESKLSELEQHENPK